MIKILYFLFIIFLTDLTYAQEAIEESLQIAVGVDEIRTYDFDYSTNILIGNESVLQIKKIPQQKKIVFRGVKAGTTSVIVWDRTGQERFKYSVNITATGASKTLSQLRELLGKVEGIEIGIKGDRVYVGGQIVVPEDWGLINTVLKSDDFKDVLVIVELSNQTQRIIARKMQDEFAKNGLRDLSVRVINKTFWIEGVVSSDGQKNLAEKIANAYLPANLKSLSELGGDRFQQVDKPLWVSFISVNPQEEAPAAIKQVKIAAQFVELSKDYARIFGYKWAPFMGADNSEIRVGRNDGGITSGTNNSVFSAVISNLFPKIRSLKNAGYARVIQSGMVIAKDGTAATISKNRQTPFAVGSGEFQQAQQQQVGYNMTVTPQVLPEENVEMDLNIQVNIPSGSSENGLPVTASNVVNTKVVIKSRESAVIGGIVQDESITAYDKNDPDGNAQTSDNGSNLFILLRSKSYNTSKSQYVVFVTPEIIGSASEGTEEIRKKFTRRRR